MKNAFSLLELIVAIVIIGLLAGIGIPKLMNTKNSAQIVTIKKDVATIISAMQTSYLMSNEVQNISDVVTLNPSIWTVSNNTVKFEDNGNDCIILTLETQNEPILEVTVNTEASTLCEEIHNQGIVTTSYSLY